VEDATDGEQALSPWLEHEIASAVAPYADKVSPAELLWMKAQLRASAASGAANTFARGAEPRSVAESGSVTRDEIDGVQASLSASKGKRDGTWGS